MKKFILLVLIVIMLTGCQSNFYVKIGEGKIEQNINIFLSNANQKPYELIRKSVYSVENDVEGLGYFTIENSKESNPLNASISYIISSYEYDYGISFCYDNQNITYSNNILKIETSNYFNCFDKYSILDDVNINVTTGYKVLENNADKVDGNTYTWNITKSNKKGIKLTLDTTVDEIQEEEKQKEKLSKNLIFIVIGTLVLFAFGTVLFVFIKSNKNNKI